MFYFSSSINFYCLSYYFLRSSGSLFDESHFHLFIQVHVKGPLFYVYLIVSVFYKSSSNTGTLTFN